MVLPVGEPDGLAEVEKLGVALCVVDQVAVTLMVCEEVGLRVGVGV